jgi:hypothetical protein
VSGLHTDFGSLNELFDRTVEGRKVLRSAGPISDGYIMSTAAVSLITGPGGSGKTTASAKKALFETQRIYPGSDGIRRYVLGVWRQKYDNLWKATIPSWWKILPKELPGSDWTGSSPRAAEHVIRFRDRWGDCELTARFRAFGEAADPEDLLGNEMTDAYLNEMSTLPEELFIGLVDRVGRDPPREVIKRPGRIFGDSNAPDVLNWTYRDFYEEPTPAGYKLFRQPGGRDPGAENVEAMGRAYWEHSAMVNAHRPWWVKRMVDARPGFTRDLAIVYDKFDDDVMVARHTVEPVRDLPILVGQDGGFTPAAVYCQEASDGQLRILGEVALERGGMTDLSRAMLALEARRFPRCEFFDTCDPAMCAGEDILGEVSDRQKLAKLIGRKVTSAPTHDVSARIGYVRQKLELNLGPGRPGVLLDPSCKALRRGFNQTFHFRKLQGSNDIASIAKTPDSHPHDALQYAASRCGSSEARRRTSDIARDRQERRKAAGEQGRYDPFRGRRA